jgi:hypothetical protein
MQNLTTNLGHYHSGGKASYPGSYDDCIQVLRHLAEEQLEETSYLGFRNIFALALEREKDWAMTSSRFLASCTYGFLKIRRCLGLRRQFSPTFISLKQCCRSGPVYFWASWIRIRILLSSSKNSKKNIDSYCFVSSFLTFYL